MKLMIDDYLRAYSPPEQANAGPGCTVINLPSANASDLPTMRGRALLSYTCSHELKQRAGEHAGASG